MTTNNFPLLTLPLCFFILGIYFQQVYFFANIVLILTNTVLALLLIFIIKKKIPTTSSQIFSAFLFFFAGALLLQTQKNSSLKLLQQLENKSLDVIATVENKEESNANRIKEILKLSVYKTKNTSQQSYDKKNFKLLCYVQTPINARVGDKIEIKNIRINKIQPAISLSLNPTFQDYLLKERVLATIFTKNLNVQILSSPKFSFKNLFFELRNRVYKNLKNKMQPTTFNYFSTIFLGNKTNKQKTTLKRNFNFWGISHYLARSGLHIILFILIWKLFFSLLPLPLFLKRVLLLFVCLIYQFFSWPSISFLRAFCVFLFYESGKLLNQSPNFLHLLSLVCFFILLLNPMQLFFLDFQLSFALTFALAWFSKKQTRVATT